jgi:hypothetical protein
MAECLYERKNCEDENVKTAGYGYEAEEEEEESKEEREEEEVRSEIRMPLMQVQYVSHGKYSRSSLTATLENICCKEKLQEDMGKVSRDSKESR